MKRILFLILLAGVLLVAYATKPDDKTCIIAAVKAVWGKYTPDPNDKPAFFEQFMNLNSKQVIVDDWIFLKRIRYRFPKKEYNIGIGAFKHVFIRTS
jgi:hypothetical protein